MYGLVVVRGALLVEGNGLILTNMNFSEAPRILVLLNG